MTAGNVHRRQQTQDQLEHTSPHKLLGALCMCTSKAIRKYPLSAWIGQYLLVILALGG